MPFFYPTGMAWPGMSRFMVPSFERIEDARSVHDQILEAKRSVV